MWHILHLIWNIALYSMHCLKDKALKTKKNMEIIFLFAMHLHNFWPVEYPDIIFRLTEYSHS